MRILIKGAGDLATGIACRLFKCGYEILMTDIAVPTAVRRTVSFSRAIYEGRAVVEDIESVYAGSINGFRYDELFEDKHSEVNSHSQEHMALGQKSEEQTGSGAVELNNRISRIISDEKIAVIVDEKGEIVPIFKPDVIVDAIIAKKNLGTKITDAPLVIGVGPGFTAGIDCHCVVETKRGHYLGKVMYSGSAIPNTGVPGDIAGFTTERIIRATADGMFLPVKQIGDRVEAGDIVAKIICDTTIVESADNDNIHIFASIPGIIRGMLQEGVQVHSGMKCGDIDPRCEQEHCYTVSDKARAIGGGVLEAVSRFERRRNGIGIVLLAAGEGKRYGSNKLLDVINGRRMFESTVDAAAEAFMDRINIDQGSGSVIVTGYDEIAEYAQNKGFMVVRNDRPELGISESLKLGLLKLGGVPHSILFAVCDQPGLTADSFRRLIDGYAASEMGLACMGQGLNLLGNPCIFSKKYFDELMNLTGDKGGKRIIMAHKDDLKVIYASDLELADIDIKPT
ncbi:MAG: EF2563 family selenium-dependent molybdenum hydroxylase system protein [Lachnospiraceae bacterium]|nr:EF2563 family selenium-dependent molybdenum hydroxylase system protein [Lachnospiraceae bacterium]